MLEGNATQSAYTRTNGKRYAACVAFPSRMHRLRIYRLKTRPVTSKLTLTGYILPDYPVTVYTIFTSYERRHENHQRSAAAHCRRSRDQRNFFDALERGEPGLSRQRFGLSGQFLGNAFGLPRFLSFVERTQAQKRRGQGNQRDEQDRADPRD